MKASFGSPVVTDAMLKAINKEHASSCSSSSSCDFDFEAAYTQKFNCYDGTFGDDVKLDDHKWVRLRSLGLPSAQNPSIKRRAESSGGVDFSNEMIKSPKKRPLASYHNDLNEIAAGGLRSFRGSVGVAS